MSERTTVILDEDAKSAARQLATHGGCSTSEAIRRAVIRQRDATVGVSERRRKERVALLESLFRAFEGNDAAAEVKRLKGKDDGF